MKARALFFVVMSSCILGVSAQTPDAPIVTVIDTDFSKGRKQHVQTLTLDDLVKLHGHLCDGLAVGYIGLREALIRLYPDSVIDRTNTRAVSASSPCLGDAAIFLSGGRSQFGTFYVDNELGYFAVLQRIDNGKAVGVKLRKGVKPEAIQQLGTLAEQQKLNGCDIDYLRKLEDDFTEFVLTARVSDVFEIDDLSPFEWSPKLSPPYVKTDIINKDAPACDH